jgi:demethylmenaquinone methyltransferase/2-methoxy-6-polyprenyl-1,4-benzoquinol methylase
MKKNNVIAFFDGLAPDWDSNAVHDDEVINLILDYSGIRKNATVLDVACGTGVLVPYYIARNAGKIIGVDISPEMIRIAKSKFYDPPVLFINGDIEEILFDELFDCCVVFNALPHFPSPNGLIKKLSSLLNNRGRLTIAHGMSRDQINSLHASSASQVSSVLMSETELASLMGQFLNVDTAVADGQMFIVSGFNDRV